jgi:predicted TIM-barrel fold metal-dependent hydrolase
VSTHADVVNKENEWRLQTPGAIGWAHSTRPGLNKYYIISVDAHLMPPPDMFKKRIDAKWHHLLPRMEMRNGVRCIVMEGANAYPLVETVGEGEDAYRMKAGGTLPDLEKEGGEDGGQRLIDQARDGVDGEVLFPNGAALLMWGSKNVEFVRAQCQAWNDWAIGICRPHLDRCNPAAALPTADIEASVKEVERVAEMGYRVVTLPCKPIFGPANVSDPNYNLASYDRLWAAIQDADLTITYHVSTGMDPRQARSAGGAIVNYVCHAATTTNEPLANMCAAGVFERFPKLRAASIEANAGWIPWMLQSMDEAYRKHHMWVRPKLKQFPSEYFRSNCYASLGEDHAAAYMIEHFGLQNNLMWANDYPHHEGSWPHSAQAIERTFQNFLTEDTRKKVLGLNAAKVFRFELPRQYRSGY